MHESRQIPMPATNRNRFKCTPPFGMWAPQANRNRFQLHGLTNFETASSPHARIAEIQMPATNRLRLKCTPPFGMCALTCPNRSDSKACHESLWIHARPLRDVGIKANRKRFELPILAYGITRTNRTGLSARARIAKIPMHDLSGLWSPWLIVPDSSPWLVA